MLGGPVAYSTILLVLGAANARSDETVLFCLPPNAFAGKSLPAFILGNTMVVFAMAAVYGAAAKLILKQSEKQ